MNVAFDATQLLGFSGINVYTRNLVSSLARRYPTDVYTMLTTYRRMDRVAAQFDADLVERLQWDNPFPHLLALGSLGKGLVNLYYQSIYHTQSKSVDLLHATDPFHFPDRVRNAVVTIHDVIPLYSEPWVTPQMRERIRRKISRVVALKTVIFVPSYFVRGELLKMFDIDPDLIRVTHEAAGPEFRTMDVEDADLVRFGLRPDDPYFLYVGRIDVRKNIDRLVAAYIRLPLEIRRTVKLVLLANGSALDLAKFRSSIEGHEGIVHLRHVNDQDLVRLLNRALALTFVSLTEGFGIPLLEAMQCACPVVSSNVSSMPEIAGDAAVLVDPYDVDDIQKALLRLTTEPALRDDLKRRGLQRAREFSWDRCARETHEGYVHALNVLNR
jgi:alpha-1,3-rhamnosyl/mannosyltransferase